MASVFVDTSGFYAYIVASDAAHAAAKKHVRKLRARGGSLLTTDYVLDETATLLKARNLGHVLPEFFDGVFSSTAFRIEWMDAERFFETKTYLLKHADKSWSFTDCFSFCLMKRLGIRSALSKDSDFQAAGFQPLLA